MILTAEHRRQFICTLIYFILIMVPKLLDILAISNLPNIAISNFLINSMLNYMYLPAAFIASLLIYLYVYSNLIDFITTASVGLLTGWLYIHFSNGHILAYKVIIFIALSGFSACGLSAIRALYTQCNEKLVHLKRFFLISAMPFFVILAYFSLRLTLNLHLKSCDNLLYLFDDTLGLQASFYVGRLFAEFPILMNVCMRAYTILPVPIAYMFILQQRQSQTPSVNIMFLFIAIGLVGSLLYIVFPAAGPIYRFGKAFPFFPPPVSLITIKPIILETGPLNAIPSLHIAWSLALWWNSSNMGRLVQIVMITFLSLTLLAVLGTGEHYFVDIVVAFPFALTLQASLTRSDNQNYRNSLIIFGGLMTMLWLYLLRFHTALFQAYPALSWFLVIGTIFTSEALAQNLVRGAPSTILQRQLVMD